MKLLIGVIVSVVGWGQTIAKPVQIVNWKQVAISPQLNSVYPPTLTRLNLTQLDTTSLCVVVESATTTPCPSQPWYIGCLQLPPVLRLTILKPPGTYALSYIWHVSPCSPTNPYFCTSLTTP